MKKIMSIMMTVLLFLLAACQTNTTQKTTQTTEPPLQKVTLILDWTPNTNHTGIYVAKEKGYFKEAGLDVSIVQPPEDGAELMVASGKAEFGISFQDTLAASFAKKLPIKAVAGIVAHNTSGILTLSEKGVLRPKQLEGLNYATWNLPIEQAIIKQIIKQDGGDPEKLNMIPSTVTDIVSALQSNVDAVWVYEGWDGVAAKNSGLQTNYLSFRELDKTFDYYTPVLISNQTTVDKNAQLVQKFVTALSKGYTFSAENPKEAGDILLKAAPELDKKLVEKSQEFLSKQYIDEGKPWGYIEAERWSRFYRWLNEQNLLDEKIDENAGFTNDFIKR